VPKEKEMIKTIRWLVSLWLDAQHVIEQPCSRTKYLNYVFPFFVPR